MTTEIDEEFPGNQVILPNPNLNPSSSDDHCCSSKYCGRWISFVLVYFFTFVLIAYYAFVERYPECHTETVPGGYNNQTETWTDRQEIEVCKDKPFYVAIFPGFALMMGSLFAFMCLGIVIVVLEHNWWWFAECCGFTSDD